MKRYLLFAGDTYYPCGGWSDLRTACDTREELSSAVLLLGDDFGWWHAIDTETMERVDGSGSSHSGLFGRVHHGSPTEEPSDG